MLVAVLDLVAELNKQLQIEADWIVDLQVAILDAVLKRPGLQLAIDLDVVP